VPQKSRPALEPTRWVRRSVSGVKQRERKVNHSPPSSVEVKNEWSYTFTPPLRLHGLDRDNFTVLALTFVHSVLTLSDTDKKRY
jgi:hypothetical protein